jgi:hypothetical protein
MVSPSRTGVHGTCDVTPVHTDVDSLTALLSQFKNVGAAITEAQQAHRCQRKRADPDRD